MIHCFRLLHKIIEYLVVMSLQLASSLKNLTIKQDLFSHRSLSLFTVLGTFAPGFRISDAVITLDVVIGRPFVLQCPSVTYTNPNNVLWGNVQENQVLLRSTRRRYILSNGDFLFTYIDRGDVNEINQQMGGVSCIYYHIGFFVQSVRYQLKIVAGILVEALSGSFKQTRRSMNINEILQLSQYFFSPPMNSAESTATPLLYRTDSFLPR